MNHLTPLSPVIAVFAVFAGRCRRRIRLAAMPAAALVLSLALPGVALMGIAQAQSDGGAAPQKGGKADKKGKNARVPTEPKKNIMVFPTDSKEGPGEKLTDIITDVIKGRLEASEQYAANPFSISSPSFRRALAEQTLTQKDVKPPYDTNNKVKKLVQFAGYSYAVTSSVDDYEYDPAKQQVSIVVTVTLIDFSGDKPKPRPFGDSASTPAKGVKDANDTAPVVELARNLTEKIMTELLKPAKPAAK